MTTDPLVVEFAVRAAPEHAFDTWVSRIGLWWPKSHTMSQDPDAIVIEPESGGRIFERATDGRELDWGEVLDWEPPRRIRYLWHLFFTRDEATVVEVTFTATSDGTAVRLVQTGWEALGDQGPPRRERTLVAWSVVTDSYRNHIGA